MASTFDSAVPDLVAVCEQHADFGGATQAVVVRDVRGRLRLIVEGLTEVAAAGLAADLTQRLGGWFAGPVLRKAPDASPDERNVAATIAARAARWPTEWPSQWTDAVGNPSPIGPRWLGLQRVLSKQAWFGSAPAAPPWPLKRGKPAIVAFYSFKGGVGRTTTLAITAQQFAAAGKKVVCVDLDLEAPGLGDYVGAAAEPSLLDHLLTHTATRQLPAEDVTQVVNVHGTELRVVAAGALARGYLEKLGRLDYLGSSGAADSPVGLALDKILKRVCGQHRPDYVLLDCRAGLHDLGGLSLSDLAHVDVLVGRDTPQGRAGLELTLDVLSRRRAPQDRRILVIQTFLPLPLKDKVSEARQKDFRSAMYKAFHRTMYAGLQDEPGEDDEAGHYPVVIGDYTEVAAGRRITDLDAAVLGYDAFREVRRRIEALAQPEDDPSAGRGTR